MSSSVKRWLAAGTAAAVALLGVTATTPSASAAAAAADGTKAANYIVRNLPDKSSVGASISAALGLASTSDCTYAPALRALVRQLERNAKAYLYEGRKLNQARAANLAIVVKSLGLNPKKFAGYNLVSLVTKNLPGDGRIGSSDSAFSQGLAIVALGGAYLVRRNLEPLSRVAGTARAVSQRSLESGEVALAERVPASDTDPNTEVGQVGLALNSMLDNVDGALRARQESETRVRQFVADASHELRTPLASIRGYAELSRKEREPVPPNVTHALGRIESESLRMQGLVEDLLLLARLDAGRPLDHDPVDLTLLAIDAVSDARAAAPDQVWGLDLPEEPIEVPGDRARLHQVLVNLLGNARAHTPPGTRVTTALHRGSTTDPTRTDVVTLSVIDDGPGIPAALQPNVFERFTRGDEARNRAAGSTGLGLSIVAAVAAAHGGRVGLRSRAGETAFVVELPAA